MSANYLSSIASRVASVCAGSPFGFAQAQDPITFDLQATGLIDQVFRIELADVTFTGGTNYSETRIGQVRVFLARKQVADPQTTYRQLVTDAHSLTAAITRDGVAGGGDYDVADGGRGFAILRDVGKEFAVLRLTLPVNYESQL